MTSSTIPDPAPGQVWECRDMVYSPGRRIRLVRPKALEPLPPGLVEWVAVTVAYPRRPHLVGSEARISGKGLRTKWRYIEEGPCGDLSLTSPQEACGRPRGHEGAHLAETASGTRAWGFSYDFEEAPK